MLYMKVTPFACGNICHICMLLTEREVRTGEYCSSSLFTCLWTEPLRRGDALMQATLPIREPSGLRISGTNTCPCCVKSE